ncbi:MAG TPA: hypothetical protein VFJ91_03700 [Gaiellaceae bacterium]|nr:hypothetical protein [Gaiellaceae bacterium]
MSNLYQRHQDLVLLAALTRTVAELAERIDGELADEATIAELHDLHERALTALAALQSCDG